jgi:hypothetical protein
VLERDGWRCQACGAITNLEVHHAQFSWSRDDDCSRPPPQIRTSGATASGSRLG